MRNECIQVRSTAPMGFMRAISGERFRNNETEGTTAKISDDTFIGVKCIIGGPASVSRYAVWAFMQYCPLGSNADFQCYYNPIETDVVTCLTDRSIEDINAFMQKHPVPERRRLTKK